MVKTVFLVKTTDGYVTKKYIKDGFEVSEDVHDARPYMLLHAALKMLANTGNKGIIEERDITLKHVTGTVPPAVLHG